MWLRGLLLYLGYLTIQVNYEIVHADRNDSSAVWKWICQEEQCRKVKNDPNGTEPVLSLNSCKMFCNDFGLLWPSPTGIYDVGKFLILSELNIEQIKIHIIKGGTDGLLEAAGKRFKNIVKMGIPREAKSPSTGKGLDVYLINESPNMKEFSLEMDESYGLNMHAKSFDKINATIKGNSFFGVRHGLETLSQLIFYDDISEHLLIVRNVSITDKPAFPYRGILLDTSRNYYSVQSIKSTLDAMAAVKLNTFHWHITDSHSFPFVSDRRPNLSKLGAYSPSQVYTKKMIRDVVQYALERGIRVLPEFNAPAHVGEGWQDTNLTVCFNAQPWRNYCAEPPCGQFNPVKEELYEYLEDIYRDMAEVFQTTDMFHMGGDEVSETCWSTSMEIKQFMCENGWSNYLQLFNYFQGKAQQRAYTAFKKKLPLILWTSTLTKCPHVKEYLDNHDYIIQVWTKGHDTQIQELLTKGYKLILSNYDALYFDCGFGSWVSEGNSWCAHIGWQKVYENCLNNIIKGYNSQILGAEAALWSEKADEASLDGRLWPRAAAMAERWWSNPSTTWQASLNRMKHIREHLKRMGIQAEVVQPRWCYQNEGYCR